MSNFVAVIGAANIDIGGTPKFPLVMKDSNPGKIEVNYGGVGRNIAHNLALLGVKVKLFSVIGGDALGKGMIADCNSLGIDTSEVLITPNETSSMYLYINNDMGDMELALSHVKIDKLLTPEYLESKLEILNSADAVVVDCNLSHEALSYIIENCKAPIYIDPVSQAQARKLEGILSGIDTIKPNRLEAEFLTGMTIRTESDFKAAAEALLDSGIRRIFISMGPEGILAADSENMIIVSQYPAEVRCTTGAGDSATAALLYATLNSASMEDDLSKLAYAAKAANAVGAMTIESLSTINPALCPERLDERLNSFSMKVRNLNE